MPPVFKALASIVAWILFVLGCAGVIRYYVTVGMGEPMMAIIAIAVACFILSVCAMRLRQKME